MGEGWEHGQEAGESQAWRRDEEGLEEGRGQVGCEEDPGDGCVDE